MKSKRIKVSLPLLTTRDDAESAMNDLALTVNNHRRIIAWRDQAVLEVTERYAADLAACEESIKQQTDALRAWAESNPDQFPKGAKSLKLASGTLGFRTGNPKVALLSRAFTWEKCLALIKSLAPDWLRKKEEADKEAILNTYSAAENKAAVLEDLKRCGLKIQQDESFFIDPDLTPTESRQTVTTAK